MKVIHNNTVAHGKARLKTNAEKELLESWGISSRPEALENTIRCT